MRAAVAGKCFLETRFAEFESAVFYESKSANESTGI